MRYITLLLLLAGPAAAGDLTGTWLKDGQVLSRIKADGTGVVRGEAVHWKASGNTLTLVYDEEGEVETMRYKLDGDRLTVTMNGQTETYTRKGGGTKAGKATAKPETAPAKPAGSDSLSQTLTASPWCYMRYNQVAGTTRQERVVFFKDGTWGAGSQYETYSSGMYGTAAGQSNSRNGGRWETRWGGRLFMSEGGGSLENVGLSMSRNSNGYPIMTVDGKEYYQCK